MNIPDPFIGRRKELELLEGCAASRRSSFVPIYGRRRVGKSRLILRFLQDHPGIYYVGKRAPAQMQRREFMREAARALERPGLASLEAPGWREALLAIGEAGVDRRPLIIALDEFQWMVGSSPELPSVLQELWDREWQPSGGVILILCGSLVGFMEREILGKQSPLFGRRTAQIRLRPFAFREAAEFHPRLSRPDRAALYFLCGGVPAYLRAMSQERSLASNIEQALLSETSPLFVEPDFLLREELREVEVYHAVLTVLARGTMPAKQVADQTQLKLSSLHYYLRTLMELGYVARIYPLTTRRPRKHEVRYALQDPLLRFWFRFVEPNLTFIQQLGPHAAMTERVKPGLAAYFGSCFERLCREALPPLLEDQGIRTAVDVGQYWAPDVQVDVVGLRDDRVIELGECKWGTVRSPRALERELADRIQRYPNPSNQTIRGNLFVRRKPRRLKESLYRWWDLDDLY